MCLFAHEVIWMKRSGVVTISVINLYVDSARMYLPTNGRGEGARMAASNGCPKQAMQLVTCSHFCH